MKCLIVGGSGQFGICLSKILLKRKYKVEITTRSISRTKKKFKDLGLNKVNLIKLDIFDKKLTTKILKKKYDMIFYFAGQSSPSVSFNRADQTIKSNYIGCKNFLEILQSLKLKTKFFNTSSSEIFSETKKKIDINSKKKPISPYGTSKLLSYNLTNKFRNQYNLKTYNLVLFNTESYFREKKYLISKICFSAINAKKFNKVTSFGKLNIVREWNWCDEQCTLILKCAQKKPGNFVLSNGKYYSGYQMLKYAFDYLDLNYKEYISIDKKYFRKKDFNLKKSNFKKNISAIDFRWKPKIFGKKLVIELVKYYLKNFN